MSANTNAPSPVFLAEAARLVAAATSGINRGGVIATGLLDAITEQRLNKVDPENSEQRRRNERAVARILSDHQGGRDAAGISARIITDAAIQQHAAETMKMHKAILAGKPFEPQSGYPRFAVWKASGERLETMSMRPETIGEVRLIAEGKYELLDASSVLGRQISEHLDRAQTIGDRKRAAEAGQAQTKSGFAAAVNKIRSMLKGPSEAASESALELQYARSTGISR